MRIPYRPFEGPNSFPLIRAGIDTLGLPLTGPDQACLDSFNGAITWNRVSSEAGIQGSEIIFVGDSGKLYIALSAVDKGRVSCRYLDVETVASEASRPLASLIHTVMAPAFTPGFVGVDWEDVRTVLGSGKNAQLAVASGYSEEALQQLGDQVRLEHGDQVKGLILTVFISEGEFTLPSYRLASRMLKSAFACDGPILIAFPAIKGHLEPRMGLLAVHG